MVRMALGVLALLLAGPGLAGPQGVAQGSEGCRPDGAAIRCSWQGSIAPGAQVLGAADENASAFHPFDVPFPARITATATWGQDANDLVLTLNAAPSGAFRFSNSSGGRRAVLEHAVLEPVALSARVVAWGWGNPSLPDRYQLEVLIAPLAPTEPAPLELTIDRVLTRRVVGEEAATLPLLWPTLASIEVQLADATTPPTLYLSDATGRAVARAVASQGRARFDVVAGPSGLGHWPLYAEWGRNATLGSSPLAEVADIRSTVRLVATPLSAQSLRVPAPIRPATPLLADAQGDAPSPLDIVEAWLSNDSADSLAAHLLIGEVAAEPAQGDWFRYQLAWRYGDATVTLLADRAHSSGRDQPTDPAWTGSFVAVLQPAGSAPPRQTRIPGAFVTSDSNAPGVVSFLVPKGAIGSPADGHALEDLRASTGRFCGAEYLPLPGGGTVLNPASMDAQCYVDAVRSLTAVDEAEGTGDYVVGGTPALGAGAAPSTPEFPIVPVVALAVVATGAAALGLRRRKAPRGLPARYRVERELGVGAFGRALLAHDRVLDRKVVLKQARAAWLVDAETRKRFLQEARLAARVHHPNVVAIHEVLADAEPPALVLEYVPGGSLRQMLRETPRLPPDQAARIGLDVLAGLGAVHAAGIVHRDIKPGNILLDAHGRAKLADFGVAHPPEELAEVPTLAGEGSQPGSLAYMSPEQARGEPVDARADLYAVGAVLFEALVGKPYVEPSGSPEVVRARVLRASPRVPPTVPRPLAAAVSKALAKDPRHRFPSASAMAEALEDAVRRRGA